MQIKNLPLAVVLLATFLPWPAAFLDVKWVTFLPDLLLATVLLGFIASHPRQVMQVRLPEWGVILIALIALHSIVAVIDGRGIGSGGLVLLSLYVVVFRWAMLTSPPEQVARTLFYSISLVYGIHILFLWLELLVRLSGGTEVLLELFGYATSVTPYKDYGSAMFLWTIGFSRDQISALQSLILGSQSASQLAVFGALWFAPIYRAWRGVERYRPTWVFVASAVMVPVAASMASTLILVGLLTMLVFMLPYSRLGSLWVRAAVISILVIAHGAALELIFFRVHHEGDIEEYWVTFSASVRYFLELPWYQMWLGYGRDTLSVSNFHADFGLGVLLLRVGILFFGLLFAIYSSILLKAFSRLLRARHRSKKGGPWEFLVLLNLMLCLGWGVSLVHYTPAVELGGRHLFAFHLAALLVSLRYIGTARPSSESAASMARCAVS